MEESVTLVEAARALRLSYPTVWNAVLRGDLHGWQDERRRWRVLRRDVAALAIDREHRRRQAAGIAKS